MTGQCCCRESPSLSTVIPSPPALPLLLLTCRNASFRFSRSHTSSMIQHVLAGRSGSCTAESDSMSSRPACRASPVGADEKSRFKQRIRDITRGAKGVSVKATMEVAGDVEDAAVIEHTADDDVGVGMAG